MTHKTLSILPLLIVLLISSSNLTTSQSNDLLTQSITWLDDFNDGDHDGWIIKGYYAPPNGSDRYTQGSVHVINNELVFNGDRVFRNFSYATHESQIAYGSWSFDVKVEPFFGSSNQTHIYFIEDREPDQVPLYDSTFCCYDIFIYSAPYTYGPPNWMKPFDDTAPSFLLVRRNPTLIIGEYRVAEINGWYHIEVTRDETGLFKVFINDSLRIEVQDNTYKTSKSFYFTSEPGIIFDNVVVQDMITNTSTYTKTTITTTSTDQQSSGKSHTDTSAVINSTTSDSPLTWLSLFGIIVYGIIKRRTK